MATARQRLTQIEFIQTRVPLEVPLFCPKSGLRFHETVVFKAKPESSFGFNFLSCTTVCGVGLFITTDRNDPDDYRIPLDVVYKIAQNPTNGTIVWLLLRGLVSQFWQSPLCEPRLMGIIAGYLRIL